MEWTVGPMKVGGNLGYSGIFCAHLIGLIIFVMTESLEVRPSHIFLKSEIINKLKLIIIVNTT